MVGVPPSGSAWPLLAPCVCARAVASRQACVPCARSTRSWLGLGSGLGLGLRLGLGLGLGLGL